jgi:hypothetical protein
VGSGPLPSMLSFANFYVCAPPTSVESDTAWMGGWVVLRNTGMRTSGNVDMCRVCARCLRDMCRGLQAGLDHVSRNLDRRLRSPKRPHPTHIHLPGFCATALRESRGSHRLTAAHSQTVTHSLQYPEGRYTCIIQHFSTARAVEKELGARRSIS